MLIFIYVIFCLCFVFRLFSSTLYYIYRIIFYLFGFIYYILFSLLYYIYFILSSLSQLYNRHPLAKNKTNIVLRNNNILQINFFFFSAEASKNISPITREPIRAQEGAARWPIRGREQIFMEDWFISNSRLSPFLHPFLLLLLLLLWWWGINNTLVRAR